MDPPRALFTSDIRAPLCVALQSLLTAVLIWSTPKRSVIRWAALPLLLYLAETCVNTGSKFTLQVGLWMNFTIGGYMYGLHCFNLLCLSPLDGDDIRKEMAKWRNESSTSDPLPDPTDKKPSQQDRDSESYAYKIYFTTAALWSLRGIGTAWELRSLPTFPKGQIPSRTAFITRQMTIILLAYCFLDVLTSQKPSPETAATWADGKQWLWLPWNPYPVTKADLLGRVQGTFMNWFLFGRVLMEIWYRVFSVVFVGLGISEVRQWPPVWGAYSECFTIRRYFNKFWHQCNRMHLQGLGVFFARDVFGLPSGILQRYATIFVVFAISGLYHTMMDVHTGIPWHKSGGLTCFLAVGLGIVLEDLFQWTWKRTAISRGLAPTTRAWLEKSVGYLWVFLWLTIVTPIYNYPGMNRDPAKSLPFYIVPWSLVGWLQRSA
ncbi:uncharacterized protein RCC_07045 [Ramularia collo-cygni]|uniref:Wax synthase domain-containing protein n=1 Tax=Ramularia collo-cygni TaxID=112498 RepID=A0A2D3VJQ5_9PEZI|nr:uncharacterized protein RCC_07045 [Ramularia collo-cygni]CZT21183.1 uncharacterized protein RCC_07045 [Ramularia collo-cygni]